MAKKLNSEERELIQLFDQSKLKKSKNTIKEMLQAQKEIFIRIPFFKGMTLPLRKTPFIKHLRYHFNYRVRVE